MRLAHALVSGLLVSRLPEAPPPAVCVAVVAGVCAVRDRLLACPVACAIAAELRAMDETYPFDG